MKNCSDEIFVEQFRSIISWLLKLYLCERSLSGLCNKVFIYFFIIIIIIIIINIFVFEVFNRFCCTNWNIKSKSNTKPRFDIDAFSAIRNRDKHYKKSNNQTGKLTKAILSVQSFCLKKIINNTKEILFEKKLQKIRIILKKSWKR